MKKITCIILLLTIIFSCFVFSGCELFSGGAITTGTTTITLPSYTKTSSTKETTTTTKRQIHDVELEDGKRKYLFIDVYDINHSKCEWTTDAIHENFYHWISECFSIEKFENRYIYENGYWLRTQLIHLGPTITPDNIKFKIDIFLLPIEGAVSELRYECTSNYTPICNEDTFEERRAVCIYNNDTVVGYCYYSIVYDRKTHTIEEYDAYITDLFDRFFIVVLK